MPVEFIWRKGFEHAFLVSLKRNECLLHPKRDFFFSPRCHLVKGEALADKNAIFFVPPTRQGRPETRLDSPPFRSLEVRHLFLSLAARPRLLLEPVRRLATPTRWLRWWWEGQPEGGTSVSVYLFNTESKKKKKIISPPAWRFDFQSTVTIYFSYFPCPGHVAVTTNPPDKVCALFLKLCRL